MKLSKSLLKIKMMGPYFLLNIYLLKIFYLLFYLFFVFVLGPKGEPGTQVGQNFFHCMNIKNRGCYFVRV
jgi:hypothetical protein